MYRIRLSQRMRPSSAEYNTKIRPQRAFVLLEAGFFSVSLKGSRYISRKEDI